VARKLEEIIEHWAESLLAPRAVALRLRKTFQGVSHANQDRQEALRRYKLRRERIDESPQKPFAIVSAPNIDWDMV
jgi:hypothetical protein